MRCAAWWWVALGLWSCGGGETARGEASSETSGAEAPPDCTTLRAREADARAALEACRSAAPIAEWPQRDEFDFLERELGARLDAVRRGEEAGGGVEDMQRIAERVWALLDEIPEDARDPELLGRVEDGAEAVIRERERDSREQALAQLAGALGALRSRLEPAPVADACEGPARDAAAAWMSAQAACGDAIE